MATGKIKMEITGDSSDVVAAYKAITVATRQARSEAKKLGQESAKAGRATKAGFDKSKQSIDVMAGGIGRLMQGFRGLAASLIGASGVLGALRAVRQEFEDLLARQGKAASTQVTRSQANQSLIRNLPGKTPEQIAGVQQSVDVIAGRTRISGTVATQAAAEALSASGGDIPRSLQAVEFAARSLKERPEAIPAFAGTLLDVQSATGLKDVRASLGFVQTIGGLSRVVEPEKQALNIPPALAAGKSFGFSGQETGALFAASSVAAKDPHGRRTGTFVANFLRQAREVLGRRVKDMSLEQIIKLLQSNRGLRRKFQRGTSFSARFVGLAKQFVENPQSEISTEFFKNLGKFPDEAGLIARAEQGLANRRLDPLEQNQDLARAFAASAEQGQTGDIAGAASAIGREGIDAALAGAGVGLRRRNFALAGFEARVSGLGGDAATVSEQILRSQGERLAEFGRSSSQLPDRARRDPALSSQFGGGPTEETARVAAILIDLADAIRENTAAQTALTPGRDTPRVAGPGGEDPF